MRVIGLISLLLIFGVGGAQIYRHVDSNGRITFSDIPSDGATAVRLDNLQVITNPNYTPNETEEGDVDDNGQATDEETPQLFTITLTKPAEKATVRENNGNVEVAWKLSRALGKNESVIVLLDGKDMGIKIKSNGAKLTNVDRGTHTLQVEVIKMLGDTQLSEVKSDTVTFYMHRMIKPKAPTPVPPAS